MIAGSLGAKIDTRSPECAFGYNMAHNEFITFLKEQRNLIENYESFR